MKTINRVELEATLKSIPKSAILTVKFFKKDHTFRSLNGRRGVKSALTTPVRAPRSASASASIQKDYVIMYDMHKKAYRNVAKATIMEIRANKEVYKVID